MKLSETEAMFISVGLDLALKQLLKEAETMTEDEMLARIQKQEARLDDLVEKVAKH
jgi:hypothetical protein